jgi:hypothetical protein
MKKRFAALSLVVLLAAVAAVAAQSASKPSKLSVTVRITQGVTLRHPHPPAGDSGDVFSVDLSLYTIQSAFDTAPDKHVGEMSFSYVLHGSCSSAGVGCKGTADITTLTKLPGGTITAVGNGVPIRTPFVVTIKSGTGKYAGVKGNIVIAPDGAAKNVYNITMP